MGWVRGQPRDYIVGHSSRMPWHKKLIEPIFNEGRETRHERSRRTRKQGPYKAGATLKAKAAARKIEQAMKGKV